MTPIFIVFEFPEEVLGGAKITKFIILYPSSTTCMSAETLERQAQRFMNDEVPQIQHHGGSFKIRDVDEEAGTATVAIGGACSGCGIAPMTMKAIERRLPEGVDGLEDVEVVRSEGPRAAVMPSKTGEMEEMEEYEDYSPPF
jgi:Fe-S cluster biogenesis protein NfuA